uniref:Non-glycosylated membrane-associated protein n=1 Tax=Bovine alphaherpesvirus 2 TaxID=10295 RepID=Q913V1_9ALPH|nr:UL24 [Bovine alphaherpesvirus 2]QIC50114.1 non-glycosylated membrane-associated protein [Bovine alphaherpesvirus 2]
MASRRMRSVNRRSILLAGMRSHVKFYKVFADEVRVFNSDRICGPVLQMMERSLQGRSLFDATHVSLICEVDLGARRPDCICVLEFENDATIGGVCVIVELKTCRYISGVETARKREQRATGLSQLRDSVRLLRGLVAPGDRQVYLCPILIFVAQETLRVSRITRLVSHKVPGHVGNTVMVLKSLSTYTVPTGPARQRTGAKRRAARKPAAMTSAGRRSTEKDQVRCGGDKSQQGVTKPIAGAKSADGGVLQKIAALFCVAHPKVN